MTRKIFYSEVGLALVLAIAIAIRLYFARYNYLAGDTVGEYYPAVLNLLDWPDAGKQVWQEWYIRLSLILPLALTHSLVENPQMAVLVTAISFSLLPVIMTYYIGKALWNPKVGLLASLFESCHPVPVLWGTQALPDPMLSACTTAAIAAYVYGLRRKSFAPFLLAGMSMGLAYAAKISGLFIFAFIGIHYYRNSHQIFRHAPLAFIVGATSVLVAETVTLSYLAGEFSFRPMNMLLIGSDLEATRDLTITWQRYLPGFLASQFWPLDRGFPYHALYGPLTLWAAIWALARPTTNERFITYWWLILLLLSNFACLGFDAPVYPTLQMRNLIFITPPACLLIAAFIVKQRRNLQIALSCSLLSSALLCCQLLYGTWQPYDQAYEFLFRSLRTNTPPRATVFFHDRNPYQRSRLALGPGRSFNMAQDSQAINDAHSGDFAVLFINSYSPSPAYAPLLQQAPWSLVDSWRSRPNLSARILKLFNIEVKKGFDAEIHIYVNHPSPSISN